MTGFPDPAARSPEEAALLAAVLRDLPDDHPKLVYADWLDDHGDPRAAGLRAAVEATRAGQPPKLPTKPAGWMHLLGLTLHAAAHEYGLVDLLPTLLRLARPAVGLTAKKAADNKLPVGASKFGGDPDLPAGADWPAVDGRPLAFMVQVNLADLVGSPAAVELPSAGLLSVFNDLQGITDDAPHYANHRVVLTPANVPLVRHRPPVGLPADAGTPAARAVLSEHLSVPAEKSPWAKELAAVGERFVEYMDLRTELVPRHYLLGYPDPVQRDVLGRKTRRHLLTLAGDGLLAWEFMDDGVIYYTLTAGDLAKGRLDRVRFDLQSG